MKQSCNKKENIIKLYIYIYIRGKTRKEKQKNTLTIRNFFKTLKKWNKWNIYIL